MEEREPSMSVVVSDGPSDEELSHRLMYFAAVSGTPRISAYPCLAQPFEACAEGSASSTIQQIKH